LLIFSGTLNKARQFAIDSLKEYEDAIKEIELEERAKAEEAETIPEEGAEPPSKKSKRYVTSISQKISPDFVQM